jgi:alkylhydroperoxidase family enzyme
MKKISLHNALLVIGFSHGCIACVAEPATTDPQADDSVDDLGAADGWSSSPFAVQRKNIKVSIAITADHAALGRARPAYCAIASRAVAV